MSTLADPRVEVWARSDSRYAERPQAFRWGERVFQVERVIARHRTPDEEVFIVACTDGKAYRLAHLLAEDTWRIEDLSFTQ